MTILEQPGFMGTLASLRADLSLVLILTSVVLFTAGWYAARHKNWRAHRWIQNLAVVLNTLVVLLAMVGVFIQNYLPGIPTQILNPSVALTAIHALSGAIGMFFGIYVVLTANEILPKKWRFHNFKIYMRISYFLYLLIALAGVFLYRYLYIR